jgi:flagellin-like protein
MLKPANGKRAISAVLSVLLLIMIVFILGIVLFNFVIGLVGNITQSESTQPFSLLIENVNINNTCMTIHVGNRLTHEVSINDEPRGIINLSENGVSILADSTGTLYIEGPYIAGGLYNIKIVFNSGNSIISVTRY